MFTIHEKFMKEAIKEAKYGLEEGDVPIGAVIVFDGKIIAKSHNQVEKLKDPTAHAEMIAITQAANFLNNWRLNNTTLYVTLEPCPMCIGAILLSRISCLVYSIDSDKYNENKNIYFPELKTYFKDKKIEVIKGILDSEYESIFTNFFKSIRIKNNK